MKLTKPIYKLKQIAKALARNKGISRSKALDLVAQEHGYRTWGLLLKHVSTPKTSNLPPKTSSYMIESLPISTSYRNKAIQLANREFERVMRRIEPNHPEETRMLWNAEDYIDNEHLNEEMLPIDSGYALSLIEAFLVHHVVDLAVQADKLALQSYK